MRKTIWKFPLEFHDTQELSLPTGAMPLSIAVQRGKICLWMLVDQEEKRKVQRKAFVIGTGHVLAHEIGIMDCVFVGTVLLDQGSLVFHVFLEQEKGHWLPADFRDVDAHLTPPNVQQLPERQRQERT